MFKTKENIWNFILQNGQKETVPHESTAQQLSFEWSHTGVSSTDAKVQPHTLIQGLTLGVKGLNSLKSVRKIPFV